MFTVAYKLEWAFGALRDAAAEGDLEGAGRCIARDKRRNDETIILRWDAKDERLEMAREATGICRLGLCDSAFMARLCGVCAVSAIRRRMRPPARLL